MGRYLSVSPTLAILPGALARRPRYAGKKMEVALEISILDLIVLVGSGVLAPRLAVWISAAGWTRQRVSASLPPPQA